MVHRPGAATPLAATLNALFESVRPPGEDREYTNREVAAGTGVSASYIGYLRKGIRDNPSVDTVLALARFFGVRPSHFLDEEQPIAVEPLDDEAPAEHQRLGEALRNPAIRRLAMRAAEAELSATALDAVVGMLEHVRDLEQAVRPPDRPYPPPRNSPPRTH